MDDTGLYDVAKKVLLSNILVKTSLFDHLFEEFKKISLLLCCIFKVLFIRFVVFGCVPNSKFDELKFLFKVSLVFLSGLKNCKLLDFRSTNR
jgi:hypothetical protein